MIPLTTTKTSTAPPAKQASIVIDTQQMVNMEEKREKITFGFGIKRKAEDAESSSGIHKKTKE